MASKVSANNIIKAVNRHLPTVLSNIITSYCCAVETLLRTVPINISRGHIIRDAAISSEGQIYLIGSFGHAVYVINTAGTIINKFGADILQWPWSICIDNDMVYITENNQVQVFDLQGQWIRSWGHYSSDAGDLDVTGNEVYVVDANNYRIQIFDLKGQFLRIIKTEGQHSWLPNRIAISDNRTIYVNDHLSIMRLFTIDDKFVRSWEYPSEGYTDFAIHGNQIYINDDNNEQCSVYSEEGELLRSFKYGDDTDLSSCAAMFSPSSDEIYLVYGNELQVFVPKLELR